MIRPGLEPRPPHTLSRWRIACASLETTVSGGYIIGCRVILVLFFSWFPNVSRKVRGGNVNGCQRYTANRGISVNRRGCQEIHDS